MPWRRRPTSSKKGSGRGRPSRRPVQVLILKEPYRRIYRKYHILGMDWPEGRSFSGFLTDLGLCRLRLTITG